MDLSLALNIATTVAVVGGVIFGAWQIQVAAKARTTQVSLQLMEMLYSRELRRHDRAATTSREGLGWDALRAKLGDRWTSVFTLINTSTAWAYSPAARKSRPILRTTSSTTPL